MNFVSSKLTKNLSVDHLMTMMTLLLLRSCDDAMLWWRCCFCGHVTTPCCDCDVTFTTGEWSVQSGQIWAKSESICHKIGQNPGLFISYSSTFWLFLSDIVPGWPTFDTNLSSLGVCWLLTHTVGFHSTDIQEFQIWDPNYVRLTNLGLFKISFSTFWLGEPKFTETDLKKFQICQICGQSAPNWMPNLRSPNQIVTIY